MPADRFGNRLQTARHLGSLAAVSIQDGLGGRDRNDVARFRLDSRSTLTLQLSGLRRGSAIGVDLFAPKSPVGRAWQRFSRADIGQLRARDFRQQVNFLARSRATASNPGSITLTLEAGEYYLRLSSRRGTTSYQLLASATSLSSPTPLPTPPAPPSVSPIPSPAPPGSSPFVPPVPPPAPPDSTLPPPGSSQPPNPPVTPQPPAPSVPPQFSRSWVRQFGTGANDYAYGIAINGESLLVSGSTNGSFSGSTNAGDRDSFVAQITTQGNMTAIRQDGQSGTDVGAGIVTDSLGNHYVSGVDVLNQTLPLVGTVPNPDGYVAKYGPAGNQIWRRSIAATETFSLGFTSAVVQTADAASRVAIDAQGNTYVTGFIGGIPSFGGFTAFNRAARAFVDRFDSNGVRQRLWESDSNFSGSSSGTGITLDAQGNIYISGITNATLANDSTNPLTGGDAFVAKLNSSGSLQWRQTIASTATDLANGVAVDANGNVYVTGDTLGILPGQSSAGGSDAFLAKYDASGSLQWLKQFGTLQLDESQAIGIDAQGRIYLAGETNGALFGNAAIGQNDAWLAAFDGTGSLLASTLIGTPQNDESYSLVVVNPAPNAPLPNAPPIIYLVGQTEGTLPNGGTSNQGQYDAWAAQYSLSPVA